MRALFSISLMSEVSECALTVLADVVCDTEPGLTEVQGSSAGQLPDSLQQPRRDFLAPFVDALLDALLDRELHRFLDDVADRLVLGRDGHSQQSAQPIREGQAGIWHQPRVLAQTT